MSKAKWWWGFFLQEESKIPHHPASREVRSSSPAKPGRCKGKTPTNQRDCCIPKYSEIFSSKYSYKANHTWTWNILETELP